MVESFIDLSKKIAVSKKKRLLQIADAPKEIYDYVINRSKESKRSVPKELIQIIEDHQKLCQQNPK